MNKRQKKKFARKLGNKTFLRFRVEEYLSKMKHSFICHRALLFDVYFRAFNETPFERAIKDRVLNLMCEGKENEHE